jgi:hypothetical protein
MSGQSLRMPCRSMPGHLDFQSKKNGMLYYFCGTRMPGMTNTAMTIQTILDTEGEKTFQDNKTANQKLAKIDINNTHDRFRHIGETTLRANLKTINFQATGVLKLCEGCMLAKAKTKAVSKTAQNRAEKPREQIGADISGLYKKSIIRSKYWILILDKYCGKAWS